MSEHWRSSTSHQATPPPKQYYPPTRLLYRLPKDSQLTEADAVFAREIAVVTRALKNAIKQKTDEMEQPGFLARMNPFGPDALTQQSELATLTLQYSQLSLLFMELGYQHIEWAALGVAPGAGLDVAEAAEDRAAPEAGLRSVFIEDAMNLSLAGSLTKLGAKLLLRGTARLGVGAGEAVGLIGRETAVDRSWKSIIVGKAQKTQTPGHQFRSYREAIRMAKSGDYDQVWLNRAYSTTTGVRTSPRRLPDVIGRRKTGQFDAIEVPSKSNLDKILIGRNRAAMDQLPLDQQGRILIIPIIKAK